MSNHAIIAGAGPAGLTCAIYLSRAGWSVDVYSDEDRSLSALASAPMIENYPGFPEGISGMELLELFLRQAKNTGAVIHSEGIEFIDTDNRTYRISSCGETLDGDFSFSGSSMILAVGKKPRGYTCKGSDQITIHTCAVCDGGLYGQNDDLIVIGGGDAAIGAALYLSNLVKSVTVLVRRDVLRVTNRKDIAALNAKKNARVVYHTRLDDITKCEGGEYRGMTYNTIDGSKMPVKFNGVFACTGYDDVDTLHVEGEHPADVLYYIGDCNDANQKQVLLACASGADMALRMISNKL